MNKYSYKLFNIIYKVINVKFLQVGVVELNYKLEKTNNFFR